MPLRVINALLLMACVAVFLACCVQHAFSETTPTPTSGDAKIEEGEHLIESPPCNEVFRISDADLPVFKGRADAGDVEAALQLAGYYGFFLDSSEKHNRDMQIHYYEVAAAHGSQVAIENLIFTYSIALDRYDWSKACCWRQELKEFAQERKIQIQSDAEWYLDLYWEYFVGLGLTKEYKKRGFHFLKCAASLGLKEAQAELADVYSSDVDFKDSARANY